MTTAKIEAFRRKYAEDLDPDEQPVEFALRVLKKIEEQQTEGKA